MRIATLWALSILVLVASGCGEDAEPAPPLELTTSFCHGIPDGTPCDDGNPCTTADRCGLGVCNGDPVDDGAACDDGSVCTLGDVCTAGVCRGTARSCSELDGTCALGACDPASGECVAQARNEGQACDDGQKCTLGDLCAKGVCSGVVKDCDDPTRPCMNGACDPSSGQCVFSSKDESSGPPPCDDHDLCTTGDQCVAGTCVGQPIDCSGLNGECRAGQCDPDTGLCLVAVFGNGTVCDDGNACTDGEFCAGGHCGGGIQMPNGSLCDDGDACTTGDVCTSGACFGEAKDCSTTAGGCEVATCDPESGMCLTAPSTDLPGCFCSDKDDGIPCDDGDPCTTSDACLDHVCVSSPVDCGGQADACNTAACDGKTGKCVKVPVAEGTSCDDGLACTVYDACTAGKCTGAPADCSWLSGSCEIGECDEQTGGCVVSPAPTQAPCDDNEVCTGHDACSNGTCAGTTDLCTACAGKAPGQVCNDQDACTSNTTCQVVGTNLVCLGEPKDCSYAGGVCTVGVCDLGSGQCVAVPSAKGSPCDDGDVCTRDDACAAGKCVGQLKDCEAYDATCKVGVCNPATGECQAKLFDDGFQCDDGDPCTQADQCNAGSCTGKVMGDGSACDDGDPCTYGEICTAGVCEGTAKDCSASAKMCLAGVCDPETGQCTSAPLEDGTPCNDLDVCTLEDVCMAGVCEGGLNACLCQGQPDGTPCDDGQKCTGSDACLGGGCVGEPVSCAAIDQACSKGSCDPASGQCVLVDKPSGLPCNDGDPCTTLDACVAGVCTGSPMDCSAKDGLCVVGACVSGACVSVSAPTGVACEDGDPCTGSGTCQAGVCGGGPNLCGPCLGKAAGAPCDDGDPCTIGQDACAPYGELLLCTGEPKDCTSLDDACHVGACDASGSCAPALRPDGTACDDQDACTVLDVCTAGACAGSAIPMCGESPDACEPPGPNDTIETAVPLNLAAGAATVMGRIDPAGEVDWYAVELQAGQLLTVESRSHCGSELDTQVGVWTPDGKTLLASADGGGKNGWTLLAEVPVPKGGTYLVGLTAFKASGKGSYILEVAAAFPPPCANDAACGCAELVCLAGKCVPGMDAEELEPNDTPSKATPVAVDTTILGGFAAAGDKDWYVVDLSSSVPVTLRTSAFCGAQTDPALAVYDELGVAVLASDEDGGGAGQALIQGFVAPKDGVYRIRVTDQQLLTSYYVLSVEDARCKSDGDCQCADEQCDGSAQSPGQCVPALAAEEVGTTPTAIKLGDRVHAALDAPYDTDEFTLNLAPGTYDFDTLSYCGSDTDTELALFGPDGQLVATDEDSGESFFASLSGVVVPAAGSYVIQVKGYGPALGEYLVRVQKSTGP